MEGGERIALSNSSELKKSIDTVSILVVDDDTTCLSIVAAILKKFKYEVVTVKHPNIALCTLRIKAGAIDLVVSDVHMPDMDGFELQQAIAQEFKLPVVLMSADDKEGVALKGLENGAAFFILKPVSPDDLRDLWQFAAIKKKSQFVIEETESFPDEKTNSTERNISNEMAVSAASVKSATNKKESKRKSPQKEGSDHEKKGEHSQSASVKKPKVIWTNSLHNRFLEAIRSIGLDRAVPKKILEVMNVPGLTRENVASHLQKYRIFLRRVSDASYKIQYSPEKGLSRNLRSSSESSGITNHSSTLTFDRFTKLNYQNPAKFPADGSHVSSLPNLEASSSRLTAQSVFGQSRLLSNRGSWLKSNVGSSTNLMIHHNDRQSGRLARDNYETRPPAIQGHLANVSLRDLSSALSANIDALPPTNYDVASHSLTYRTNYVGYSISSIKHLTKSGHSERYEGLNSCPDVIDLASDNLIGNNTRVYAALTMKNDSLNQDHLAQNVGANYNSLIADNNGGEALSDVIEDYRLLLSSNLPWASGVETGGEFQESSSSLSFDLSEFDFLSTQQHQDKEGGFETTLANQVSIQNQAQQNGSETTANSNFYGVNDCHWNYRGQTNKHQGSQGLMNSQRFGTSSNLNGTVFLPTTKRVNEGLTNSHEFGTSSQLNKTLTPFTERDDDDFLESLLVPFGEDPTLEGI